MGYTIDMKKTVEYKTRQGKKAVVSKRDAGLPAMYFYLGFIENADGNPSCRTFHLWRGNGAAQMSGGCSDFDIVGPWKEEKMAPKVDWSGFPARFRYLAMDEGGKWFGYFNKPKTGSGVWETTDDSDSSYEDYFEIDDWDEPDFDGDWKDSLCVRPGVEKEAPKPLVDVP